MEFEKLFKVVVLGGSVIAGGCAPKNGAPPATQNSAENSAETSAETSSPKPAATEAQAAMDCKEVCEKATDDGETICPDPSNNGLENCCWLMQVKHECCPS